MKKLTKEECQKLSSQYPKDIICYPRLGFEFQLVSFIRKVEKYILDKNEN